MMQTRDAPIVFLKIASTSDWVPADTEYQYKYLLNENYNGTQ